MRKFMIEREIPGIGGAEAAELSAMARRSNECLRQIGPDIQWVSSFVAADKAFCIYFASDEDVIRRHAVLSGFPADKVTEIKMQIDPTTSD